MAAPRSKKERKRSHRHRSKQQRAARPDRGARGADDAGGDAEAAEAAEDGDRLALASVVEVPAHGVIRFHEPLVSHLLLSSVRDSENRAESTRQKMLRSLEDDPSGDRVPRNEQAMNDTLLWASLTAVGAMAVLEAFVTEIVPSEASYESDDGRSLDRDGIEELGIEQKVGDVLPAVLGKPSIKGTSRWETFERIRALRSALADTKRKESQETDLEADSKRVWARIIRGEFAGAAGMCKGIMEHFAPEYMSIDRRRSRS